jgi:hypothetical protein
VYDRPVDVSRTTTSRFPKMRGSDALTYVPGWLRYMRALLAAFSRVCGNEKSWMLSPVKRTMYRRPWPGKLPANGVNPWM